MWMWSTPRHQATPLPFVLAEQTLRPRSEKWIVRLATGRPASVVSLASSLGSVSEVGDCRPMAGFASRVVDVGVANPGCAAPTDVDSSVELRRAVPMPVAATRRPSRLPRPSVPGLLG